MVEPMNTSFMSTYRFWAGTAIAYPLFLVKVTPQNSIWHNLLWTAASVFFLEWFIYGVYVVILWPKLLSPLRHLPGPSGGSFFNGHFAAIVKEPSGLPLRRWVNQVPNDGIIRYLYLFNRERLLVVGSKALSEVLTTKSYDFVKPQLLRVGLGSILGIGIIFAEGDEHKAQRKGLTPAFNFRHVRELYPIFWAKSREMLAAIQAELRKQAPNRSVEVGEWSSRATLDIIGVAGMGQDFNSLADPNTELNQTYRKIFQPSRGAQILGLLQFFIPTFILTNLPFKRNDEIRAAAHLARETARGLIRRKKERLAAKEKLPPDIISVALESGNFDEENLVDNCMTFLAAGHETTASALSWAIHELCKQPEIQTRLRCEVRSHISSLEDSMDANKLDHIAYLQAVCNETLRVWSPVPLTLRDTENDTVITGQVIPRGTKIILCPWAVNFSKELWGPDAEEFKPDRWLAPGQANSGGAKSNYAFLTFLHGPRSCIGQKFAVAELACLLAAFVGRFEFEMTNPNEEIKIKGGITARPENGMHVNIKVVEGW